MPKWWSNSHSEVVIRAQLATAALLATALCVGPWALLAPRSFYDTFPGLGRHWVSPDGPYNEHLVRDLGSVSLALLALGVAALVIATPQLFRITGVVWLVYSVPHLIYHAHTMGLLEPTDQKLNLAGLAATVAAAGVLAVSPGQPRRGDLTRPSTVARPGTGGGSRSWPRMLHRDRHHRKAEMGLHLHDQAHHGTAHHGTRCGDSLRARLAHQPTIRDRCAGLATEVSPISSSRHPPKVATAVNPAGLSS